MNSAHMAAWTNHRPAKAAPGGHEGGSELPGHRPKAAMTFPEDHTGELDLADRHALRRVAGLSTELTDVTEVEYRALPDSQTAVVFPILEQQYRAAGVILTPLVAERCRAEEPKLRSTFSGHTAAVWSVVFSPDSKVLASGGTLKGAVSRNRASRACSAFQLMRRGRSGRARSKFSETVIAGTTSMRAGCL